MVDRIWSRELKLDNMIDFSLATSGTAWPSRKDAFENRRSMGSEPSPISFSLAPENVIWRACRRDKGNVMRISILVIRSTDLSGHSILTTTRHQVRIGKSTLENDPLRLRAMGTLVRSNDLTVNHVDHFCQSNVAIYPLWIVERSILSPVVLSPADRDNVVRPDLVRNGV